jgi:hypothetical protein
VPRTRLEIEAALLAGQQVGDVQLRTAEQRRMLRFLLHSQERGIGPFTEAYVKALKEVFLEAAPDAEEPASAAGVASGGIHRPTWRLERVEAEGFGGVNTHGGRPFVLDLAGSSICVEGYNGQGKTSLASIVAVGLTGQRIGQHGPSPSACQPSAARDATNRGAAAARWPPAVAYPATFEELATAEPRAMVRLTFADQVGAKHTLETTITAQGLDPPRPGLPPDVPELLVELAILMPNRIPHLRIGEDTRLVEVLVQLIGLEPLRELGEHVAALCHGSKNFAGFPKTMEIKKATDGLIAALQQLGDTNPALAGVLDTGALSEQTNAGADVTEALERAFNALRRKKAELFVVASVDAGLDLTKREDQAKVQQAVGRLQTKLDPRQVATLPAMRFLKMLNALDRPEVLEALATETEAAEVALRQAEQDRQRQLADRRLRLKAAAADWHREHHPQASAVDECPLCERALADDTMLLKLGAEIQDLRRDAGRIRRTFGEACAAARAELARALGLLGAPEGLPEDPLREFIDQFRVSLQEDRDLQLVLPAARQHALEVISAYQLRLPSPPRQHEVPTTTAGSEEAELCRAIAEAKRLSALITWWPAVQLGLAALREATLGREHEQGKWTPGTLGAALEDLLALVAAAAPIDEALRSAEAAQEAASVLGALRAERALRNRIVEALEPLKGLTKLVDDEARTALSDVATLTRKWFSDVYYVGNLGLGGAAITRKGVLEVEGILGGVLLDAALVANTSWLRAFLWAFVFALRQHTLERLGHNPFPLLLLDDPQATFDNCHERQWAVLLSAMAADAAPPETAAQIFVTSHDPKLFELMAHYGGYDGRRAAVHGLDPTTGCLRVLDGAAPERAWAAFEADRRPETAQEYIAGVRILVEARLALILHAYGIVVAQAQVNTLLGELDRRKEWPFFSAGPVRDLLEVLRIEKGFREALNASHHAEGRHTLSEPDADRVRNGWNKVRDVLELACAEARRLEFLGPRRLPLEPAGTDSAKVIPLRIAVRVKPAKLPVQGRVAAATDGRVSLGVDPAGDVLSFPKHGAMRLRADTLAPVASVGDILLARLFHEPRDGDLVVADVGGVLRARRIRWIDGDPERAVLIATAGSPQAAAPPIVIRPSADKMWIIDGVLHERRPWAINGTSAAEVEELPFDVDLAAYCGSGSSVWEVNGESASPVALDGQFLLVGSPAANREELTRLNGRMVLAEVASTSDEPERYLKRLRLERTMIILESIESGGRFPPVLCSTDSKGPHPALSSASQVNGVLFAPPKSRSERLPPIHSPS